MSSIFLKQLLFVIIFAICNLALFSVSSTFHKILGYDLNTLEEWLYHNRLFLITISKLVTLVLFLILPQVYNVDWRSFKSKVYNSFQIILKYWKLDSKIWILQTFGCFVLYAFFYDVQFNENSAIYSNTLQQILLCIVFWTCDLIFVRKLYEDNIFINYSNHKIINACLQSLSLFMSTAVVSYLSWFDLLQFALVLICIFYLFQNETSLFSGHIALYSFIVSLSLFHPMNFIISTEEIKFNLIAQGFSLPWSFIYLSYYFLFMYLSRYSIQMYRALISKKIISKQ